MGRARANIHLDAHIVGARIGRHHLEGMPVRHHRGAHIVALLVCSALPATTWANPDASFTGTVRSPQNQPLEITLPDGVQLTLEPGSVGTWMPAGRIATETHVFVHGYHLVLREGEIEVRMPLGEKGRHAFLLSTWAGTLTDWRGKAHVMVHGGRTAAAIYEGALVVGSNGHGFAVFDGAGVVMHKGFDPDKSRPIPSMPVWDSHDGGTALVLSGGKSTNTALSWMPVPGAASYRVAIARDPALTDLVERAETKESNFTVRDIPAGATYYARVRAVGPEGIAGEWSNPRRLRSVRYELPEGASVGPDGTFVMPEGTAITLLQPAGLQMAFEAPNDGGPTPTPATSLYWTNATPTIEPARNGASRIVYLRDTDSGQETRFGIVRRTLRADIALSPPRARAGDPIDVRAVVWNPSGRIDPSGVPVQLVATLGLEPIPAKWKRSGTTFTSRIFSVSSDEPSVVRIVATDSRGTEIGRGMLELAAGPPLRRNR